MMIAATPVFQEQAVCLTKFGPEAGETAKQIVARKDFERRAGNSDHQNEFWWGVGERGTAQSVGIAITKCGADKVLFCEVKNQTRVKTSTSWGVLVWRKYRQFGSALQHDIPPHVLLTSAAFTNRGAMRSAHYALVCHSIVPLQVGGQVFRFANSRYRNLLKDGSLGQSSRGQRTTTALVKSGYSLALDAECDTTVDFSAKLLACVELHDSKPIQSSAIASLSHQIGIGMEIQQWQAAVSLIRR
jgi:hypothetical protein